MNAKAIGHYSIFVNYAEELISFPSRKSVGFGIS